MMARQVVALLMKEISLFQGNAASSLQVLIYNSIIPIEYQLMYIHKFIFFKELYRALHIRARMEIHPIILQVNPIGRFHGFQLIPNDIHAFLVSLLGCALHVVFKKGETLSHLGAILFR